MALSERRRRQATDVAKLTRELLRQRDTVIEHGPRRAELEARIKDYEARYRRPSDSIHDAIDRGEITETQEVCRWIMDYDVLQRSR